MNNRRAKWWPWIGFIIALAMHLWRLGLPAAIVSDEVYFVKDAERYQTHQAYLDAHPPLGKLQIAAAIKVIGDRPWAWRIVNAIEGALLVPLLWWLGWLLTGRRRVAALAMILGLVDGFILVESRLGLINIPYILYAFTALGCVLTALKSSRPWGWLLAAGAMIGAALSVKWLAIPVLIPTVALWIWPAWFGQRKHDRQPRWSNGLAAGCFAVLPPLIYYLVFKVHFAWLHLPPDFWALNAQILNYHLSVPSTGDPNAQPWWGWLLAWKPFPYWIDVRDQGFSSIRSLPNVWIWWTGALVLLYSLWRGWRDGVTRFLNVALLCTWIPFMFIQRVMYSYHAIPFGVLLTMLTAVYLGKLWPHHKKLVIGYLTMAVLVFVFFAPWYFNIPLSPQQTHWREWLPSWRFE